MRPTQARAVRPYDLPLRTPWTAAGRRTDRRQGFLVRWEDQDGFVGWGDAAPLPGADGAELEAIGRQLHARLDSSAPTSHPAVENAVHQAVADAAAKRLGEPLWRSLRRLLGNGRGAPRQVSVNATIGLGAPSAVAKEARRRVADGYRCLKLKAADPGPTVECVAAVREAVGERVALRVDANGAWSRATAASALKRLEPFGLEYVEQPIPPGRLADWRWLRARTSVPLAADEDIAGPKGEQLIERAYCSVAVLKPMVLGGLDRGIRLAGLARAGGIDVVVTDVVESAVGRQGALHLAAAAGSPKRAHGVGSGAWLRRDVVARPPKVVAGRLRVPTGPGLGLEEPG